MPNTDAAGMQARVQVAVLRQLEAVGLANSEETTRRCPGSDSRDFSVALQNLLDQGAIDVRAGRSESLAVMARLGWLNLTAQGRKRLQEDDG